MRAAPAVSVRCTGGLLWRAWCALAPVLSLVPLAAWVLGHAGHVGFVVWGGACLAGALLAWPRLRRQEAAAVLAWDGGRWTVGGDAGQLTVMLDTGRWMLLRLRIEKRPSVRWVAVSAREAGAAWHLLRSATYALPLKDRVRPRDTVRG